MEELIIQQEKNKGFVLDNILKLIGWKVKTN
jgi:hypothetical protein